MKNKKILTILAILVGISLGLLYCGINYNKADKSGSKTNITTYNMSQNEIESLPSNQIENKTITDEQSLENDVPETENFQEQGTISYDGTTEYPNVSLGDYTGLTYYSQLDSRWSSNLYTSTGNSSQTIGSSGCCPTSEAMIVTATKGTITPDQMASLFVKYGYRSANDGTYWSACKFVADTFNLEYSQTTNISTGINEAESNQYYIVVACGQGLFTTGGHYIVITGYENGYLKIYDPYLYAGKFDTSTRKGKAIVQGNTVLVTPSNFSKYANAKSFFIYTKTNNNINTQNVSTASYDATVKVNSSLRVRNSPNGTVIGSIANGTNVTVYSISGNWAEIGNNKWVSLDYIIKIENNLGTYYISCSSLKLRTEHNLNSTKYIPKGNIITKLDNGIYVNVEEIWTYYDQVWARIPQRLVMSI